MTRAWRCCGYGHPSGWTGKAGLQCQKSDQCFLRLKAADVANLCHELRPQRRAIDEHSPNHWVFRQVIGQVVHLVLQSDRDACYGPKLNGCLRYENPNCLRLRHAACTTLGVLVYVLGFWNAEIVAILLAPLLYLDRKAFSVRRETHSESHEVHPLFASIRPYRV